MINIESKESQKLDEWIESVNKEINGEPFQGYLCEEDLRDLKKKYGARKVFERALMSDIQRYECKGKM